MFFDHHVLWLPKDLNRDSEYQDAYFVDGKRGVAAVADGVASSLFSASWANILAKAMVHDPPNTNDAPALGPWLAKHREEWLAPIDPSTLAWHQKPKFQEGAFATILWIELFIAEKSDPAATGEFQFFAYAVGDTCLFHVRGERLLRSFPLTRSEEFDNDPLVIGSIDKKKDHLIEFSAIDDYCQSGDLLVICTDAVAARLLYALEQGEVPDWSGYWNYTDDDWRQEIAELRGRQAIRQDDSTLLLLRVGDKKQ
jgi:hypothetical protein